MQTAKLRTERNLTPGPRKTELKRVHGYYASVTHCPKAGIVSFDPTAASKSVKKSQLNKFEELIGFIQ